MSDQQWLHDFSVKMYEQVLLFNFPVVNGPLWWGLLNVIISCIGSNLQFTLDCHEILGDILQNIDV